MPINTQTKAQESAAAPVMRRLLSELNPAMRWALLFGLVIGCVFGIGGVVIQFIYYGFMTTLTSTLIYIAAMLLLAILITLLQAAFKRLRWQTSLVFFLSFFLCVSTLYMATYLIPIIIFGMAAVYLSVMATGGKYKSLSTPKRIFRYGLLGIFSVVTAMFLFLTLWPGPSLRDGDRPDIARLALPYSERMYTGTAFPLDNPSTPGSYSYSVHYYAPSGQKIEPYPNQQVMPSRTVDVSELVEGWNGIRRLQQGLSPDALPLNAQVWMPEGTGPFPLALIVHGNHESGNRSDAGYAYLGELLASRGIIAASVDQNFLNMSYVSDIMIFARLDEENDARAFIMLEHLRQWYDWNNDESHPFSSKVDFENIAMIGHSRGGEAVAVAAAFADLEYYPNNGLLRFDYPFRVKTVVAIAPSHGQYEPAGLEMALANINYLVLHGGHDLDVFSFMGANTYRRTDVSEYGVKAQIWIQYANHGQFNSSWISDWNDIISLAYQQRLIISMEEQQQAAKVFISAFLESTLHGREEYNTLFRDFTYGADWLPPTLYVTDYTDSRTLPLDSYDSGFDLGTASSGQVGYSAQGFDTWTQNTLPGKYDNSNRVLILSWGSEKYREKRGGQLPVFTMRFKEDTVSVGDKLYISLCSDRQSTDEPGVSFQIRLTDVSGNSAAMSINDFGGVADPVEALIGKPLFSAFFGTREPVLQMVCIPTERFEGLGGDIVSMEWIMDEADAGKAGQTLYADDLRVKKQR